MNENLSKAQFGPIGAESSYRHEYWERTSKGVTRRGLSVIAEHPKYGQVGEMALRPDVDPITKGREVYDVNAVFPRSGIGRGLWNHAQEAGLEPRHSPTRTDQGDAWAHAVGGRVPPRDSYRGRNDA